jgi:hypothetical protein
MIWKIQKFICRVAGHSYAKTILPYNGQRVKVCRRCSKFKDFTNLYLCDPK